ncbi:2-keto-4-pentenoate hydratase/2-oxohepta-3-ene-1,7-dioic acid hydratase in catechol pathway [Microbacteriaceae bacterium MWH-Ta3]|nr:2-keto-4-pentenoate hydratase/2-oxohepta-3-ene-1,7-dioic acid hydratase in catechol pathway [Microbacteriaceae bacterium MWH-Ta3]
MKIARFTDGAAPRYGIVDDDAVVALVGHPLIDGYDTTGERIPLDSVRLLAPVIPSKVVCVGMNYPEHVAEMHHDGPKSPLIFLKPSTAVVGPGDPIVLPPLDGRIVHEGELAIVVGKVAHRLTEDNWRDAVWGYTIGNDVSARDVMFADGQWARAKGFDTFCPIGPWIETDLDPQNVEISTFVDGEPRRHGNTKDMIHPIAEIMAFVSNAFTLLPGDVILTGTPAGLGGFLDGQTVEITIEGIGTLANPARNRDDRP